MVVMVFFWLEKKVGQQKQDYKAGWHFRSGSPEGAKRTITEQVADFEVVGLRKAVKQQKQDFSAG